MKCVIKSPAKGQISAIFGELIPMNSDLRNISIARGGHCKFLFKKGIIKEEEKHSEQKF
jgi:hypothetical protein